MQKNVKINFDDDTLFYIDRQAQRFKVNRDVIINFIISDYNNKTDISFEIDKDISKYYLFLDISNSLK